MTEGKAQPLAASAFGRRRYVALLLTGLRHACGWTLRAAFLLFLITLVFFAYLHLVGLPSYFSDALLNRLAAQGYFLQIERLTLEVDRGLVAKNVRLFLKEDAPRPFLESAELSVALNPIPLLWHQESVPLVSIVEGSLRFQVGQNQPETPHGTHELAVTHANARLSIADRKITLHEFAADFLDIHFRGRGAFYPAARPQAPATNPLALVQQGMEEAPAWVLNIVEQLNRISFDQPPQADFVFSIAPDQPARQSFSLQVRSASGGQVQGVAFSRLDFDVALNEQQVRVPNIQILTTAGILALSGHFDLADQTTLVNLHNTLPPDTLLRVMPPRIQAQVAAAVPILQFPLQLDLQLGPTAATNLLQQITGRLSFGRTALRNVPIEALDVAFAHTGPEITIGPASVQFDTGPHASKLSVPEGRYNLTRRDFQARVRGTINPHLLKPLLTPNMQAIVDWFEFQEPIQADVMVGGTVGNPAIYCYGPVQATNFSLRNTPIQSFQTQLNITNEVMHMTRALLARPEGMARGDIHMAFSNQTLRLDNVESTLDPRATADMLGPAVATFLKPFVLNGPLRLRINGLLDYCNFSLNQLQAQVEAQGFGFDRWVADTATFDLAADGMRIHVTNALATAYGGQAVGSGYFYPVGSDTNWRYEVELTATNVNLTELLEASFAKPVKNMRGTLDGTIRVGGYFGQGTGPQVVGSGQATVRGGLLFQTKLFSGLSAILDKILPDFNLFAQTDANGHFTIRNSRITSRDIDLQGTMFSVKATGDYFLDGNLNYRVEVQLLRNGTLATIVRLATLPVTRLLEFRLTGTFEDPRWRPVNLNLPDLFSGSHKTAEATSP